LAVDASPGAGRVLIALSAGPLVAEPTWTRHDELGPTCRCYGFDWQRGRQSEFDVTNTGTARVYFHDMGNVFASEDFIGLQIMLQLFDPVAATWEPVFRGHIDDAHNTPSPGAPSLTNVQLDCVDIFAYLAEVKMVVGVFGDTAPAGMDGVVFYEDEAVNLRLDALADDAGLAASMYVHFDGNVDVCESLYDTDDDILSAMRDAADAEFPGVANVYVDRYGREVFHGRFARFDPDGTSSGAEWDFNRWNAATREDVTSGRAQIREFQFNRPRTRIINSYTAWPELDENHETFDQALIASNQTKTDATSITAYGYRGQEAPALIIKEHKTNGNTGAEECELFGEYYVNNYAEPRKNVERITFKTLSPDDALSRDAATWALMTRADISDVIHLFVDEAGLADAEFFIEGISGECRVGNPQYDFVTVTPNLSPAAYYLDNVFEA
jgi:hypothetical protein